MHQRERFGKYPKMREQKEDIGDKKKMCMILTVTV
jgi:hypothetical protein